TAGGVVGDNFGTIENCYSTGSVSGLERIGGIAGSNFGSIKNCYSTGYILGESVGGVVDFDSGGTVINCVALNSSITKTVVPFYSSGRIIGTYFPFSTINGNYASSSINIIGGWAVDETTHDGKDGADITAAQYNTKSWWEDVVFFDFDDVWYWDDVLMLPVLHDPAGFSGFSASGDFGDFGVFLFDLTFEETNESEPPFDVKCEDEEYALLPEEENNDLLPEPEEN
ncbi:MAG: hypothetical protein FWG44_07455, partial [Oscillospiraceae bacterium]|nr:hypothetical protein [Oscillospiraceae bacterium]